jgi:proline dehydrogenase
MPMLPKRPKGVLSKGQGASNFVPSPYSKTGKDKFQDVVSAAMDTAETQKDRANIKSVIYSAGRKYKVDAAVVEKAAKAAEKMYAKPKPAVKATPKPTKSPAQTMTPQDAAMLKILKRKYGNDVYKG